MDGFLLLLGHLIGDYILQDDRQASNKTNPWPGPRPGAVRMPDGSPIMPVDIGDKLLMWDAGVKRWWLGHLACTVHSLLYTLAVWVCSWFWMPWWGAVICFVAHWPIDRFRLARVWMERVSGQKAFANGVFAPWSVILVDNIFHLATLALIAVLAGRVG